MKGVTDCVTSKKYKLQMNIGYKKSVTVTDL